MNQQTLVTLLAALAAVSITSQLTSSNQAGLSNDWAAWKQANQKVYGTEEEAYRFAVFTAKDAEIQKINAEETTSTVGHNLFSDLTQAEFKSIYLGYVKNENAPKLPLYKAESGETAQSVNWVTGGAVTPVKNQGQCGSCWAFGTVGGIEGGYYVANQKLQSFSEQQITSCDTSDSGCGGGDLPTAYDYVNGAGLCTESEYPYTSGGGQSGSCEVSQHQVYLQAGAVSGSAVQSNDRSAFTQALSKQPLSICIEADQTVFSSYTSGVITSSSCGTQLDHCVTAVGFDLGASQPYALVKNSWASSWGDQGYVRIGIQSESGSGICGIYEEPYLAVF